MEPMEDILLGVLVVLGKGLRWFLIFFWFLVQFVSALRLSWSDLLLLLLEVGIPILEVLLGDITFYRVISIVHAI